MKVLVIDDDVEIHSLIKKFINPLVTVDCLTGLPSSPKTLLQYDLIVLDLWLEQNKNSMEFLSETKDDHPELLDHIILLTGSGTVDIEIQTHKLGIRDYIKKPFDPRVFSAIIDKHLTNLKKGSIELRYGPFHLDLANYEVFLEGESSKLELTQTEFKILRVVVESKGRIVTRERLMTEVWDMNEDTQTRTVDMHISTLRKKLGKAGENFKTKRGYGYYISEE